MGESRECRIVRKNLADTTQLISTQPNGPSWFAQKLEEKAFIGNAAGAVVLGISSYQNISQLMGVVKDKISTSLEPEKEFATFIGILWSNPALVEQAKKLLKEYGENGGDAAAIERQLQPHTVSQPAGKVSHDPVVVEKQSQSHATTPSSGASASNTSVSADTPLKMKYRPKIMKYLKRIGNTQTLLELGESLGLDGTVLRTKTTTDTFLYDFVGDWLNRVNTVDEEGTPTWRKLAEALEDVDQNGIANDIKKDMGF